MEGQRADDILRILIENSVAVFADVARLVIALGNALNERSCAIMTILHERLVEYGFGQPSVLRSQVKLKTQLAAEVSNSIYFAVQTEALGSHERFNIA